MAEIQIKQTKYMTRAEFNALDKTTIPIGTEINIVDQIQKEDLSTDLQNAITSAEGALPSSGGTISGNLSVNGNLTVSGTISPTKSWHDTPPADTSIVEFTSIEVVSSTNYPYLVGAHGLARGYTTTIYGVYQSEQGAVPRMFVGAIWGGGTPTYGGFTISNSNGQPQFSLVDDTDPTATIKLQYYY